MTNQRLAAQVPASSSNTITTQHTTSVPVRTRNHGTLVLRAEPAEERHIAWAEDVVDNEGMGKKSSKVCCIYHKPRGVDESSGEESSDSSSSDSDSDSDVGDGRARPVGRNSKGKGKGKKHNHDHDHGDDKENDEGHGKGKAPSRKRSPNAYEKQPKYGKKPTPENA